MSQWIWDGYEAGSGWAFAESQEGLADDQEYALLVGTPLDEPLPEVRVTALSPGRLPDAMASVFNALLVSDALRAALDAHVPRGVQYLPATVEGKTKAGAWWAVNATARVAALDREGSEYETYEGTDAMRKVRRLVLRPVPEDAPALFHLEEIPQLLLVSDGLRRALEAAGNAPGVFQAPEEWRLGVFDDEE